MKPMLADSADIDAVDTYVNSDEWWANQKLDGDRLVICVTDGEVTALNRHGERRSKGVPGKILRQFARMQGDWVFDGELLDELWLFDLPKAANLIEPGHPYQFRVSVLERFFAGWQPDGCIRLLPTARTKDAKISLFEQVCAKGGEGLMFKHSQAPYIPGKRSARMLKAKFTHTADVFVTGLSIDGKANCSYGMFDGGQIVDVGSCSLNGKPSVRVGDVIEVRYLYASEDRRLFQPRMVRVRTDKAATECTVDQLMFTNREVVMPDERPIKPTTAAFVSRLLREAGLPKCTKQPDGYWTDGFEVFIRDGMVHASLPFSLGRSVVDQARDALLERDLSFEVLPDARNYTVAVRGRHY